jgi:hypothetical protein
MPTNWVSNIIKHGPFPLLVRVDLHGKLFTLVLGAGVKFKCPITASVLRVTPQNGYAHLQVRYLSYLQRKAHRFSLANVFKINLISVYYL